MIDLNAICEAAAKDLEVEANATPGVWTAPQTGFDIVRPNKDGSSDIVVVGELDRDAIDLYQQELRDNGDCYLITAPDREFITHAHNTLRSRCETMLAMADEIERLRRLLDKPEGISS